VSFQIGDLVTIGYRRKFPVVLRSGPGYSYYRTDVLEPGQLAIIIKQKTKLNDQNWLCVFNTSLNAGWILESMVDHIEFFE